MNSSNMNWTHSKREYMQKYGVMLPMSSLVPISFSLHHKSFISVTLLTPMLCTLLKILKTTSTGIGCQITVISYLSSYIVFPTINCTHLPLSQLNMRFAPPSHPSTNPSHILESQTTNHLPRQVGKG